MNRFLKIALCLPFLTACTTTATHPSSPELETGPAYITGSKPNGPVNIGVSDGTNGWDVTASQPYNIHEERIIQAKQPVERYVFTPYTTLPGLIQCTGGGIAAVFTLGKAGHELLEYGCPRIVMLEKLKGTAFKPLEVRHISQTHSAEIPLTGAVLRVVDEKDEIQWEGVLGNQGRGYIPYRALSFTTNQDTYFLRIVSNGITVGEKQLSRTVIKQDAEKSHTVWPEPTIFAIDSERHDIRAALIHALTQTGYLVIAGETEQHALEQESILAMNERVSSNPSRHESLKQTAATVLVQAKVLTHANTEFQLRFLEITTGKELKIETWKIGGKIGRD